VDVSTAAIRALLPAEVAVAVAGDDDWERPLLPGEEAFVHRAVEKRRREFRAGRACARAALGALGLPPVALPVGPEREPVWPAGVVGSISHAGGLCVAAVARRASFAGLGVDVETSEAVRRPLWRRIARHEELAWLEEAPARLGGSPERWASFVFSAKESLYKAVRALVPLRLGFLDACLEAPHEAGAGAPARFRVRAAGAAAPWAALAARIEGRFVFLERHVVTAAVVAAGPEIAPSAAAPGAAEA